jgi:hypothetical protein
VANALTRFIKKFITLEHNAKIAKKYGTRSLRKATMTENRINWSLSTQKEYTHSGHTALDQNANAEGYIETTAAMMSTWWDGSSWLQ